MAYTYKIQLNKEIAFDPNDIQLDTPVWLVNKDKSVSEFITKSITITDDDIYYRFVPADPESREQDVKLRIDDLNSLFFLSKQDAENSITGKKNNFSISSVNDIKKYLNSQGITVTTYPHLEYTEWKLQWYSKAGEGVNESLCHFNTVKNVIDAINSLSNDFDPEEHAMLYVDSVGKNGVPTLRELVDDAYDIQRFLNKIASELSNAAILNS